MDEMKRSMASYIAREVSGQDSPGQVILHVRRGKIRNPGQANADDLSEILRDYLPKPTFSGKVIINTGLGGIAHKEQPFVFEKLEAGS